MSLHITNLKRSWSWKLGGLLVVAILLLIALTRLWPENSTPTSAGREWTCSMHPQIRQTAPGQCPICGMNLVPVEHVADKERLAQRTGVETEAVSYRELFREIHTVGKLDYNERRVAYLTARIAGRVDRVYADFTGIHVNKEDHLVEIYSPDLVVTTQNLLDALTSRNQALAAAARQRLLLWGMLPQQIKDIEKTGQTRTQLTIHAPMGGTIIEKAVREGQYLKEGDMLYRIADLDPLWLYLDAYEYDLAWVRYGQHVEVRVEAYPGERFRGTVVFIDPFLNDQTRTVKVRVNLPNPEGKLKPAMYASAFIRVRLQADGTPEPTGLEGKYLCPMHPEVVRDGPGQCPICEMRLERVPGTAPQPVPHDHPHAEPPAGPGEVLAVPATAVLTTGRRTVAYRQTAAGNFELVELRLGLRAEGKNDDGKTIGYFPILAGLDVGDRIAVRGGFLLDSQTQIEGRPSLLYPEGSSATHRHSGHGKPSATPPGGAHQH